MESMSRENEPHVAKSRTPTELAVAAAYQLCGNNRKVKSRPLILPPDRKAVQEAVVAAIVESYLCRQRAPLGGRNHVSGIQGRQPSRGSSPSWGQ